LGFVEKRRLAGVSGFVDKIFLRRAFESKRYYNWVEEGLETCI
jgi:hypothetical protein